MKMREEISMLQIHVSQKSCDLFRININNSHLNLLVCVWGKFERSKVQKGSQIRMSWFFICVKIHTHAHGLYAFGLCCLCNIVSKYLKRPSVSNKQLKIQYKSVCFHYVIYRERWGNAQVVIQSFTRGSCFFCFFKKSCHSMFPAHVKTISELWLDGLYRSPCQPPHPPSFFAFVYIVASERVALRHDV